MHGLDDPGEREPQSCSPPQGVPMTNANFALEPARLPEAWRSAVPEQPGVGRYRRKDAARYLEERYGVGSPSMLAKLAVFGGGPRFFKFGARVVLYLETDLDSCMHARLGSGVTSTSEK